MSRMSTTYDSLGEKVQRLFRDIESFSRAIVAQAGAIARLTARVDAIEAVMREDRASRAKGVR